MEQKILEKAFALQITALQNDVQELKAALQARQLKEEIITNILLVQDEKTLQKMEKAIRDIMHPKRPGDKEEAVALQGNR